MNHTSLLILTVAAIVVVIFGFMAVWAFQYVKVGPNQVLIVSGRRVQLPGGKVIGFRMVQGGGTFVFPVIEKAEVLSLEVFSIEMPKSRVRTRRGETLQVDCAAQVKIRADETSIVAAAESFLSKSEAEIKNIVRPILEKHLRTVIGSVDSEELQQAPGACADRIPAAAADDLARLGLGTVSLAIQQVRPG